ncbi:MAG TPA: aminotransferase class I/II-fold pyridoxal phosphate-dependent enzyme [Actinomycetota bacterium]
MPAASPTAARVPGSGIREIVNLVVASGADVLRLEVGEPGFRTPAHIVEAAHRAAMAGTGYTQSVGTLALREAISAKLERVNRLRCPPDRVIVSQGAAQGCSAVLAALLEPGDEVLIPDPAWPNYEMLALLHGAVPVRYPTPPERGFLPDVAELEWLVGPRARVLVFNSPANPSGAVYPPELVVGLLELAARHDLVVLADEVYDQLIFEGAAADAASLDPERVVGLYSFSKTYAMTGWRVGYVAAPSWLAPTLWTVQEPLVSCVSAVSQAAALAALEGPQDCVGEMRDAYRRRRDLVVALLGRAGIEVPPPRGAFNLMLPFAPGVDGRLAALDLVEHGVATAPGTAFGEVARSHTRLSLASSEEVLSEAVERLVAWYRATGGGASLRVDGAA